MGVKIGIVGGGSTYTPGIAKGLIEHRAHIPLDRVTLMDLNREKVEVIAALTRNLLRQAGLPAEVETTQERERAIEGADFLISQVRIGGLAARIRDERTPLEFDMVGNETVGPGGFVSALRTVPFAVELAALVARTSPRTVIINFTNPSGIVTEAMLKHTTARVVGLCNIPTDLRIGLAHYLGVDPSGIMLDYFGLNHLGWVRAVYLDGQDVLPRLIAESSARDRGLYRYGMVDALIPPQLLQAWGMLPNWYVRFYCRPEAVLAEQRRAPQSRGEQDLGVERQLLEMYARGEFGPEAERLLAQKGGSHYAAAAVDVIVSILEDRGERLVLDVRNEGALPDLPAEVCVEVPSLVGRKKIKPLPQGPIPLAVRGLLQTVKAYEELTVEAALTGNRNTALEALMANPLVGSYDQASGYLERVLDAEREFLPRFFA